MKSLKLCIILSFLLLCTGCGKQIEQEQFDFPETIATETTAESIIELIDTTVTVYSETTAITTSAETSVTETSSAEITAAPATTQESVSTKLIATEIVKNEQNPEETEIIYYYGDANDNSGKKQTTFTSKATAAKSTKTSTTTTKTTVTTDPVIATAPPPETTTVPETEPETETEPEFIPLSGSPQDILNQMTLEQKVYQMFIVTPEMLTGVSNVTAAGSQTQQSIYHQPVGGLVYFSNNLVSGSQTANMLSATQQYAMDTGVGVFLAVDEEGGAVARCAKKLGTTALSPMATYGEHNNWNEAYQVGQILGNDIRQFGFNVDFAPVADVNLNSGNELGNRIFSDNPDVVANMVSAVVQGLQDTGTAAALKHFPGLGAENGNAHYDSRIIIDRSLDDLRNVEFIPFRSGIHAGVDFVMVSHQIITGAGDNLPSCLSPVICTDLLRNELGFNGIIITDSFQMNTISGSYSAGDAAVMAINAGVDVILMPTNLTASVQAVENAVLNGSISEERINQSVYRILLEKEKLNLLG